MSSTPKTKTRQCGYVPRTFAAARSFAVAFALSFASGPALAGHGYTIQEHPLGGDFTKATAAAEPRGGDDAASATTEARTAAPIQDIINSDARFSVFANALKKTDIWKKLETQQHVTLFLPTDRALRAEGSAFLLGEVLLTEKNSQRLRDVMSYHVYFGQQLVPEEIGMVEMVSDNGACFPVSRLGTGIRVGPEAVVTEVIPADEGSLFVIDRLLWQPWSGEDHCGDRANAFHARR